MPEPRTGGDPRYLQVATALRKDIVSGVYPVGSQLPTEHELCEQFSVSRYTVREALRRLRDDNLVSSRPRAGTLVIPRSSSHSYVQDVVSIDDLLAFAAGAHFNIETTRMITVDRTLADRTGMIEGEEWLTVQGYRRTDGELSPVCWTEYYINRAYAGVGRLLGHHTGAIFPLIEDLFGQRITEVHQEITATLLSPALSAGLDTDPGDAALEMVRSYRTSEGDVAQVTINTHPASRYRHSMTMRRVRD